MSHIPKLFYMFQSDLITLTCEINSCLTLTIHSMKGNGMVCCTPLSFAKVLQLDLVDVSYFANVCQHFC